MNWRNRRDKQDKNHICGQKRKKIKDFSSAFVKLTLICFLGFVRLGGPDQLCTMINLGSFYPKERAGSWSPGTDNASKCPTVERIEQDAIHKSLLTKQASN